MNIPQKNDLPADESLLGPIYMERRFKGAAHQAPSQGAAEAGTTAQRQQRSELPIGELALSALGIGLYARIFQSARRARFG